MPSKFLYSFGCITLSLQWIALTLMVVIGYLVAPVLFHYLPEKTAGEIAGRLFDISSYVYLMVFSCVLALMKFQKQVGFVIWSSLINLVVILLIVFVLAPWMDEIKSLYPQGGLKASQDWTLFASLHGIYQLAYLLIILLLAIGIIQQFRWMRNTFSTEVLNKNI